MNIASPSSRFTGPRPPLNRFPFPIQCRHSVACRQRSFIIDANGTVPLRLGVKYEADYLLGGNQRYGSHCH